MQLQNSKIFESEQPILVDDEDTLWSSYSNKITEQIARCSSHSKPDFLIIAPARTGTTWLAENLRRHPSIYIPPEKEVRYFDIHWRRHDITWYLERVSSTSAQFSGEATPTYALLPSYAIELVRLLNPRLKLIFIMRDPAARAWSHMKHNFINREANFALSPITDRLEDLDIQTQCENFVHDYPLCAGDYEGALTRWSRYFPQSQFHLTFFEEIYADPDSFLRNVLRFIGVDEPVALSSFPVRQKINRGIDGEPSDAAAELLRCLYTPRARSLARFLRTSFRLAIPWNEYEDGSSEKLIWLMDTTSSWRIYLFDGSFWAIEKASWKGKLESSVLLDHYKEAEQTNVKRSAFLGDLLRELDRGSVRTDTAGVEEPLGQEDRRLTYILKDLARYYDRSLRSSIVRNYQGIDISQANRAEPHLLEEGYRGFNFIAYDHKVWAVDQRVGPTDLRDVSARKRLAAEGRLVAATTLDGARLAVDICLLEERVRAMETRLDEFNAHMSKVELNKQLVQDTGHALDRLRSRVSEFESTFVRICEECQQSVSQAKSNLEEQIGDLRQNTLLRMGYYITKKIKKVRET